MGGGGGGGILAGYCFKCSISVLSTSGLMKIAIVKIFWLLMIHVCVSLSLQLGVMPSIFLEPFNKSLIEKGVADKYFETL